MYINNNEILDTDAIDIIEEELKEELCMAELCMVIPPSIEEKMLKEEQRRKEEEQNLTKRERMMRTGHHEDLLQATLKILCDNSKTPDDVLWVGTIAGFLDKSHRFTWEEFASKANFVYDFGYGQIEILHNLIIVGKDFWLDRCDWDGSEWWEFNQIPSNPELTLTEREGGYEKIVDGVLY